jgi:hypothetical protein
MGQAPSYREIANAGFTALGRDPINGSKGVFLSVLGIEVKDQFLGEGIVLVVQDIGDGYLAAILGWLDGLGDAGVFVLAINQDSLGQFVLSEPIEPFRRCGLGIMVPYVLAAAPEARGLAIGNGNDSIDRESHKASDNYQAHHG